MADELQYYGDPSSDTGLTVIARVYDSTGTQVSTDVSCTEVGSLAIYQGDMPTAAAGSYGVRFFNSTTLLGQGVINWDGSAEVTDQTLNTAISTKATQSSIDALNDLSSADVTAAIDLAKLDEVHAIHGLDASNPMTVTPTSRVSGSISQTISGDGENTSTVTRD
jgi:hypothetical protein